jgi:hypothetical protein
MVAILIVAPPRYEIGNCPILNIVKMITQVGKPVKEKMAAILKIEVPAVYRSCVLRTSWYNEA